MRRETISYKDYDGNEREEMFYFNLTREECISIHAKTPGGLGAVLDRIVKANDRGVIHATFEDLLGKSYGVKSEDGRRLMKGKDGELFAAFKETLAYDELICKLISVPGYAAEFFNDVIPTEELKDLIGTITKNAEALSAQASMPNISQVK